MTREKEMAIDAVEAMAATEVAVETNEGTFGAAACCRATGCGDPRFGNYTIYERVGDGRRRVVGCDPANAPGYPRKNRDELVEARRELRRLRMVMQQTQ